MSGSFGVALTALVMTGCASHAKLGTGSAASTQGPQASDDALEFRNIFYSNAVAAGVPAADVSRLIYLPPSSLEGGADQSSLSGIDAAFVNTKPSQLYDFGNATPMQALPDVDDALSANPVTIVVLPGIFGEFIANAPFQEVLDATSSSFAVKFRSALQQAAATGTAAAGDYAYSMNDLQNVDLSLSDVVTAASIDDANGAPLVNVAYMKPRSGSLESMGTIAEDSAIYLRRLAKLWTVLGVPEHFYLLGYSRGAPVALDVAAAATSDTANTWASSLAGVITLGGVNYGTPLADVTQDMSQVTGKAFAELNALLGSLTACQSTDSTWARTKLTVANTAAWGLHGVKLAYYAARLPSHPELSVEGISSATPDYARLWNQMFQLLTQDTLRIDQPIADYCGNVSRFIVFAQKLIAGAVSLTTAERMGWWQNHVLPTGFRLIAVTGTMGDPTTGDNASMWPLTGNSTAYDSDSIDYKGLRSSYYDLLQGSQISLNDSQVPMSRAWLWPGLASTLNPGQGALETHVVATLGEHHWGFAFPAAFPMQNGEVNPFPRTVLMHSLGSFIARLATTTGDDGGSNGGGAIDGGAVVGANGDDGGSGGGADDAAEDAAVDATGTDSFCSGVADGAYCGGDQVGGDPSTIYQCVGQSVASMQVCPTACVAGGAGTDTCN